MQLHLSCVNVVCVYGGRGGGVRGLKMFCQRGSGSTCFVCVCVCGGGGGSGSEPLPSVKKLTDPPPIDK